MKVEMPTDYAEGLLPKARETVASPVAKKLFDNQSGNERLNALRGLGAAPDFSAIFKKTVLAYAHALGKDSNLLDDKARPYYTLAGRADDFMEDMRAIEMEDTIFPDVKTFMPELLRNADGVALWTSGHPNYQFAKIDNSKIEHLLEGSAKRKSIISRDKEVETKTTLEEFLAEHPARDVTVTIYDDSQGNFAKVEKTIEEVEEKTGRKINPLYVWAVTGRVGESFKTDEDIAKEAEKVQRGLKGKLQSVRSFADFTKVIKGQRFSSGNPLLVLLDFDGALSDNRLMRFKQYEAFIKHAKKAVVDLGIAKDDAEAEGVITQLNQILVGEEK